MSPKQPRLMSRLASASVPLNAVVIAASFKQGRKVAPKVGAVLAALARTGFVITADGGATFSLRRAALMVPAMAEPFTLRIFVPSGDPDGVRIVDRMNWTGRGYVVPRDRWGDVRGRPEMTRPGVYVLIGYEPDELGNERPIAYIGQTDNLRSRIESHDLKKDF